VGVEARLQHTHLGHPNTASTRSDETKIEHIETIQTERLRREIILVVCRFCQVGQSGRGNLLLLSSGILERATRSFLAGVIIIISRSVINSPLVVKQIHGNHSGWTVVMGGGRAKGYPLVAAQPTQS
jgi:hypothetical protein